MWFFNKYENSGVFCFIFVERISYRFFRGIIGFSRDIMCICLINRRVICEN